MVIPQINIFVQVTFFAKVVLASQPAIRGQTNDISFINFVQHTDHKLDGKPLKTAILKSVMDCLIECNMEGRCLSININTTSHGQDLFQCVLLDIEKHEYLEKFIPVKGIDHYSMPVRLCELCLIIPVCKSNIIIK